MGPSPLRGIMESQKLTGPNFADWLRNLRIILKNERRLYVLDEDEPEMPPAGAPDEELAKFERYKLDVDIVQCYMLGTMSNEL